MVIVMFGAKAEQSEVVMVVEERIIIVVVGSSQVRAIELQFSRTVREEEASGEGEQRRDLQRTRRGSVQLRKMPESGVDGASRKNKNAATQDNALEFLGNVVRMTG
ncbi:hypothetical protein AXG93_638s1220 [Marchantia polymorpha subsp. ruderalis]|uniref:Uncharacterized protein n=1 Tax=Marchantia polymorpha subsp. ruderalis TaxID=1480154 RepID=A0A176W526_MARPO|nr:hypothetical protein AXG93_638s1220 [Marchantia polymorpha subsp. ruderalis]